MKTLILSMDYNCQPINIGDFIQNLLVCSILVERNSLEAIDVNIINDPELEHADPQIAYLLSEGNKKRKTFDIIQSLQLVPNIRNIKFYRQATEVIEYYKTTIYQSQVFWPSLEQLAEQKYFFYDAAQLICNHILETKTYPKLSFSDFQLNKAHQFYRSHAYPYVPVTVNLRNNPFFHGDRNALLSEWKDFFAIAADQYPVKFIIISSFSEIDPEISKLKNVVYAKQCCTSLVDDLSLLHHSAFHLGNPSGPSLLIYYSEKPYHIFNWKPHIDLYGGTLIGDTESIRYRFANPYQNFGISPETTDSIMFEFDNIWRSKDWLEWAFTDFYKRKIADVAYWF